MDFRFDTDQLALQAAVRQFCADLLPLSAVAGRESVAADSSIWQGLAGLGVLGMLGDEGDATGAVEAAIVFEALGAHLCPGPVLWSTITATHIEGAGDGSVRVTGIEAVSTGPIVVPHAGESSVLAVVRDDQLERIDIADVGPAAPGASIDPLTPMVGYAALPAGQVIGDAGDVEKVRRLGRVLSAASLVGTAQGALDTARAYALGREQFGRPIGSFQAVKHLLADMYVRVELARSSAYAAAATLVDPRAGNADRSASAAKVLAGEAAIANGRAAIQILGGMGFTWDMLPHYYLKRAWVLENWFGSQAVHARALADAVEADTEALGAA
jgi:alkylation response protein AidB-like acyl-CoA dehydrogenase